MYMYSTVYKTVHVNDLRVWFLITVADSKIPERYTFEAVNAANEIVIDDETILPHVLYRPLQTRCQYLSGFSM